MTFHDFSALDAAPKDGTDDTGTKFRPTRAAQLELIGEKIARICNRLRCSENLDEIAPGASAAGHIDVDTFKAILHDIDRELEGVVHFARTGEPLDLYNLRERSAAAH